MTSRPASDLIQASLLGDAVDEGTALVFVADEHGRYVAVNRRACDVLGYTREELLELRVKDVATASDAEHLFRDLLRRGTATGTTEIRRKDGEVVTMRYEATETKVAGLPYWLSIGFVD